MFRKRALQLHELRAAVRSPVGRAEEHEHRALRPGGRFQRADAARLVRQAEVDGALTNLRPEPSQIRLRVQGRAKNDQNRDPDRPAEHMARLTHSPLPAVSLRAQHPVPLEFVAGRHPQLDQMSHCLYVHVDIIADVCRPVLRRPAAGRRGGPRTTHMSGECQRSDDCVRALGAGPTNDSHRTARQQRHPVALAEADTRVEKA